jgi:hypothetical protein
MSTMLWVLVLAGVLTPLCVRAQVPGDFAGVREGDRVRIRVSGGQLMAGRYVSSSLSSPRIQLAEGGEPIVLEEVDSLWVRGSHGSIGAIVGSVVGAGAGLGLGLVACELGSDGEGCQQGELVALVTLTGAGVGLGLGALVGSAFPRWRLRYARSDIAMRLRPMRGGITLSMSVPLGRTR